MFESNKRRRTDNQIKVNLQVIRFCFKHTILQLLINAKIITVNEYDKRTHDVISNNKHIIQLSQNQTINPKWKNNNQ